MSERSPAPRQQLAVQLYQDGAGIEEVAAFMGIQPASVRQHLALAGVLQERPERPLTRWVRALTACYPPDEARDAWFRKRAAHWLQHAQEGRR